MSLTPSLARLCLLLRDSESERRNIVFDGKKAEHPVWWHMSGSGAGRLTWLTGFPSEGSFHSLSQPLLTDRMESSQNPKEPQFFWNPVVTSNFSWARNFLIPHLFPEYLYLLQHISFSSIFNPSLSMYSVRRKRGGENSSHPLFLTAQQISCHGSSVNVGSLWPTLFCMH